MAMTTSRTMSFLLIIGIYAVAFAVGVLTFGVFSGLSSEPLISLFAADVAATLVVWLFGVVLKNSSVYDPYWSVAPPVLLVFWLTARGGILSPNAILFLAVVLLWGVRLTANWAKRWKGIRHEDWRYRMYKKDMPKLWPLVNLVGINLMPTVLVFGGMVSVFYGSAFTGKISLLTAAGAIGAVGAVVIEWLADSQMDRFRNRKDASGKIADQGLWKFSRHPNYFGEVSFWWCLWFMQAGTTTTLPLATALGPFLITLLFVFVSVPLMEKHVLSDKPDYAEYVANVSALVPFFRNKRARKETD